MEISKVLAEKADKNKNNKWILVAYTLLGYQLMNNGQFIEAATAVKYALDHFDPLVHNTLAYEFGIDQEIIAKGLLANIYTFLGNHAEIALLENNLLEKAHQLNHLHSTASTYLGLSCTYFYLGNKDKVKEYSKALMDLNHHHNSHIFGNYGLILNAWAWKDLESAQKAMIAEETMGILSMRSFWYTIIACIELESGMYIDAHKRLHLALSLIGQSDGPLYASEIHRLLANIHLESSETDLVKNHFQNCQSIATQQGAKWILEKAESLAMTF